MTGITGVPRTTADLVGHERAERLFLDAATAGRLHHAWLLAGPSGIGKATLAYRIARFMLGGRVGGHGPDAGGLDVPASDPVFRRIASGGHPDLLVLERPMAKDASDDRRQREIPVAQARRIQPFLGHTSGDGGWRVVIVDEAETLNRNAANAILKAVEEPHPRVIVLLVCNQPAMLPATLRSRCRRLDLAALGLDDTARVLEAMALGEAPEDVRLLAELAAGRPGRVAHLAGTEAVTMLRAVDDLLDRLPTPDDATVRTLATLASTAGGERWSTVVVEALDHRLAAVARRAARGGLSADDPAGRASLDRWVELWDKTGRSLRGAETASLDRAMVIRSVVRDLCRATAGPSGRRPSGP